MKNRHYSEDDPVAAHCGKGVTRRAVRLRGSAGRVDAALEDHCHAMLCSLDHDGGVVTAVEADFRRYTLSHCPAAAAPLGELLGMNIDTPTQDFFAGGRARRNCTQMLDLAWMALRHAGRGAEDRLYEIDIPDARSGRFEGILRLNGDIVLAWTVEDNVIMAPGRYAGRPLWGGLLRWAMTEAELSEEELEFCLVLHKGFFMTSARRLEMRLGPLSEAHQAQVVGRCFGYAPERIADAVGEAGMFRDFSASADGLLRFE